MYKNISLEKGMNKITNFWYGDTKHKALNIASILN